MKSVLFPAVLALCGFGMPQQLEAQKLKKDPESYRVIVTMSDSSTVEGYLKKGWHADNSFLKTENYSFKLVKNPDDKEPVKYTAEEVLSIDYAGGSEQNPDGIRWESHAIASPGIGNRNRTVRRLVCLDKAGENATVYWWKNWEWNQVGNIRRRELVTRYGIRFHNDPENRVYPYMLIDTVLMDDVQPGLKEFCKNWFKGPQGKEHKKASKTDELWVLDLYDAYLASRAQ